MSRTGPRGPRPDRDRKGSADRSRGRERMRQMFQQADANNDEKVTLEEVQAVRPEFTAEMFQRMDRNGDGAIDAQDRGQGPQGDRGERAPRGDRGDRGDRGERGQDGNERMQRRFQAADANGDGVLSFEEAAQAFGNMNR